MFLNNKSAFPSIILNQLVHNMRQRGMPEQYTNWIRNKVEGRWTTMAFYG